MERMQKSNNKSCDVFALAKAFLAISPMTHKKLQKLFSTQGIQISLKDYMMLDEIVEILTKRKGIEERTVALSNLSYDLLPELVEVLANEGGFSTYHSLS